MSAAMDCSTKSRAREIPRHFSDGRPAPKPLRSEEYPEGLPHLSKANADRVATDNKACTFVLDEIQQLAERGGDLCEGESMAILTLAFAPGASYDADGDMA